MKYKIKNKFLLLALLSSAFFFLVAPPANAVWGIALALAAPLLLWFVQAGFFLVAIKIIHALSGKLINWGINAQSSFLNLDLIQSIWTVLRDFVNIFFILILLVIAFATIFNKPTEYKAKELLPKLIIAALLINFSLVIAVWIIELLWVPAQVFLNPFTIVADDGQKTLQLSEGIAQALNVQKFYNTTFFSRIVDTVTGRTPFASVGAIEELFRTVLLFIEAYVFAWIALIIWARIPILLGLMIVSPVAWLGLAFPTIRKQTWSTWWQKIFCWGAIPIPLFGLIYFVILFNQKLSLEVQRINDTIPNSWYRTGIEALGLQTGEFIIWLLTISVFLIGLWYVRNLSCSLGSLVESGFKKTWGGIGRGVGFAYTATGAAGAVGAVRGRIIEEKGLFGGVLGKQAREGRIEDRLARWAGLKPTYATQRIIEEQSEKAKRDIENELKQARSTREENVIIEKLRKAVEEGAKKGTKNPETLAAIKVLAKKGQLDAELFNKAVENFKDMPLTLTSVLNEWKEGKFGGLAKADDLLAILKDIRVPLEAKRIGYSFIASDDGKRVAEGMKYEDARGGLEILGRHSKGGRDYFKFWADFRPTYIANYRFENKEREYKPEDLEKIKTLQEAIKAQIEKASVKDFGDYFHKEWTDDQKIDGEEIGKRFKDALEELLEEKEDKGLARKFVVELRRKLRREGKDKQFEELDKIVKDMKLEVKEEVIVETE